MNLGDYVFLYCERSTSVALLAEPFNAASNAAFLLAALAALWLLLRRPKEDRSADHYLLIVLVFLIGLGSLSFHLLATQTAEARRYHSDRRIHARLPRLRAEPLPGHAARLDRAHADRLYRNRGSDHAAQMLGRRDRIPRRKRDRCGEMSQRQPCVSAALGAMVVIGGILWERKQRTGTYILWAALVFAVSVTFRSLDMALCDAYTIQGQKVGTHFAWHLLNGLALFLLLRASLEVGPAKQSRMASQAGSSQALLPGSS